MADAPPLPPICPVCGADPDRPFKLCDHGALLRGEVGWVFAPEENKKSSEAARHSRRVALGALLIGLIFLAAAWACFSRGAAFRAGFLTFGVIGFLVSCGAWLEFKGARALARIRHFSVYSPGKIARGTARIDGAGRLDGSGEGVASSSVSAGFSAASSTAFLARVSRPNAYSLLRVALLSLASRGLIKARLSQRVAWTRTAPFFHIPRVLGLEIFFSPDPSASRPALPWLEGRLLAALEHIAGGDPGVAVASSQGPYRAADAEAPTPARWASLGELLVAFHRAEKAQPFHRKWLIEQASSGAEVGEPPPGEGSPPNALTKLLGPSAMRKAHLEETARQKARLPSLVSRPGEEKA